MARFQADLDAEAFEGIVSTFTAPALAVARRVLRNGAQAEDAVQEAFLRVVRNREVYLPAKPFSSWFYAIVRNVCLDMNRRGRLQDQALAELARRPILSGGDGAETGEALQILAGLPESERDVLVLRIVHGLRFSDIAIALGIAEEAAKKRSQRGLRRLRERISASHSRGVDDSVPASDWTGRQGQPAME